MSLANIYIYNVGKLDPEGLASIINVNFLDGDRLLCGAFARRYEISVTDPPEDGGLIIQEIKTSKKATACPNCHIDSDYDEHFWEAFILDRAGFVHPNIDIWNDPINCDCSTGVGSTSATLKLYLIQKLPPVFKPGGGPESLSGGLPIALKDPQLTGSELPPVWWTP